MSSWFWQIRNEAASQAHSPSPQTPSHGLGDPPPSRAAASPQPTSTISTNESQGTTTSPPQPTSSSPSPPPGPSSANPLIPSTTAGTIISTLILTSVTLTAIHIHRTYLRRIPTAASIPPSLFRHPSRTLWGRVAAVTDADNFRLFHTPGGLLNLWRSYPASVAKCAPFRWRHIPPSRKEMLAAGTIHVRIAGIDAPELAHFGRPAQPHSKEAMEWLAQTLQVGRKVRVRLWRRDQYERVVGTAWIRSRWGRKRDIGLDMIRAGWATVYEAKYGAEFGGPEKEQEYRLAEAHAKKNRRGMWSGRRRGQSAKKLMFSAWQPRSTAATAGGTESRGVLSWLWSLLSPTRRRRGRSRDGEEAPEFETPREYKTRMARLEAQKATAAVTTQPGRSTSNNSSSESR